MIVEDYHEAQQTVLLTSQKSYKVDGEVMYSVRYGMSKRSTEHELRDCLSRSLSWPAFLCEAEKSGTPCRKRFGAQRVSGTGKTRHGIRSSWKSLRFGHLWNFFDKERLSHSAE